MTTALRDTIDSLRERLDCRELAKQHGVQLRKHSAGELCGPCPRCGGDDRFYVSKDYAACRQCHEARMDAVGLVAWLHNVTQGQSVAMLDGGATWQPLPAVKTVSVSSETETSSFAEYAPRLVQQAQERLDSPAGAAAREYLTRRGLAQDTWRAFGLGCVASRKLPDDRTQAAPAVTWPVFSFDTGALVAVRYRFIVQTATGDRYDSLKGSTMRGHMFGVQGLPAFVTLPLADGASYAERTCALVLCEGELNAMSIWQACAGTNVHVLSTGSQSVRRLPDWTVDVASRYGAVLTWFDEAERAANIAQQLPGAVAVRSPITNGEAEDANDILRRGLLAGLVQKLRISALRDASLRESVLWQLVDSVQEARQTGGEADAGTVKVVRELADELGRHVTL